MGLLDERCYATRHGWWLHFRPHSQDCPNYEPPLPASLPWDDPNSDPLGDINRVLDKAIDEQDNPLIKDGLRKIRRTWIPSVPQERPPGPAPAPCDPTGNTLWDGTRDPVQDLRDYADKLRRATGREP